MRALLTVVLVGGFIAWCAWLEHRTRRGIRSTRQWREETEARVRAEQRRHGGRAS